jgi:hypothetical protein
MAILGRRTTQRLIDETAPVISRGQIRKLVDELNSMPETQTLSPDWELILLNAFSKIGHVKHEQSFGGNRKPDVYFECRSNPRVRFVADIRTLSDKGFNAANPFDRLFDELIERVQQHTVCIGWFVEQNRGLRPSRRCAKRESDP